MEIPHGSRTLAGAAAHGEGLLWGRRAGETAAHGDLWSSSWKMRPIVQPHVGAVPLCPAQLSEVRS